MLRPQTVHWVNSLNSSLASTGSGGTCIALAAASLCLKACELSQFCLRSFVTKSLCDLVGSVLDSTYSAALPREVHIRDLVTKDLKQNCESSQAFRQRDAAASAMQVPPDPVEARDEFKEFTQCTVCGRNIHNHSHTCYKPPNGYHGCRMCRPAGDSDKTKAIELFLCKETDTVEEKEIEPARSIPEDSKNDFSPLTSPDNRIVLWELSRQCIR